MEASSILARGGRLSAPDCRVDRHLVSPSGSGDFVPFDELHQAASAERGERQGQPRWAGITRVGQPLVAWHRAQVPEP